MESPVSPQLAFSTPGGESWHGDSLSWLPELEPGSVDLVCTSPPFALTRKKSYGNEHEDDYVNWFRPFARAVQTALSDSGSFVIDLGGAWQAGSPTRSLYQYRLLIDLVDNLGFHLAEDFYWFNRAKLPGPRQWVNIDRTRVKDAVNVIWWLSKTESPKADNRNVLRPYSKSMLRMLERGTYNSGPRPSEHTIGENWAKDQGGAIAPNVIEVEDEDWLLGGEPDNMLDFGNTASNDPYNRFLRERGIRAHPARFPRAVPEFFVKFLTEPGDTVVDPFGGSNMTGAVAENLGRSWKTCELDSAFVAGSVGRFEPEVITMTEHGTQLLDDEQIVVTAG